jgi:hypothetical protein
MVVAMDSVIRESNDKGKDRIFDADEVDSLRVDTAAEPADPALPKLAAAWARLQDHVSATFQNSVSTCHSTVSQKKQVVVNEVDRHMIMCSTAANDGREYIVATTDATKLQIKSTHDEVVRKVGETTEEGMAKLATARAETMRKVEDTHSSITETYDRAKETTRESITCMPTASVQAEADADPALTEEQVEQLREAFSVFDKSGDGKVTAEELGRVMEECGESVTEAEIKEMIKDVDVSVDGTINFEEFKVMMARLAVEEAGLPLSKRIAKVPLKMKAQWRAGVRHAQSNVEQAQEETARAAAEKLRRAAGNVREAEASVNTAVEKTKQAAIDAKRSTVGWLDSALASVLERIVPPPEPPKPKEPVLPTLGTEVGDMDDTTNAYVW